MTKRRTKSDEDNEFGESRGTIQMTAGIRRMAEKGLDEKWSGGAEGKFKSS